MSNNPKSEPGIDVMVVDIHGTLRGKRIPLAHSSKVFNGDVRLPVSTLFQDVWGNDNDELTGLAISIGDPDGVCKVTGESYPTPWTNESQQVIASLYNLDGTISFADSRAQLQSVLDRYSALQLIPVVAVELEFYLLDLAQYQQHIAQPPLQVMAQEGKAGPLNLYDIRTSDRLQPVLDTIAEYAHALGLPIEASLGEFGPGQLEINLQYRSNAIQAADEAVLLKRCVEQGALQHGFGATFMAKPYTQYSGSGMHVHVSLLNDSGDNIFNVDSAAIAENSAGVTDASSSTKPEFQYSIAPALEFAVAGILNNMHAMQLFCAPLANSYKRLQPDNFAPTHTNWSHDHRGVAVRLPATSGPAARLEYRSPGADANPYLVLSAVLSAILDGLDAQQKPAFEPVLPGQAMNGKALTHDWLGAIDTMAASAFIKNTFGEQFQKIYTDIKRAEVAYLSAQVSDVELQAYLSRF